MIAYSIFFMGINIHYVEKGTLLSFEFIVYRIVFEEMVDRSVKPKSAVTIAFCKTQQTKPRTGFNERQATPIE